jgi:death-on-curing protein
VTIQGPDVEYLSLEDLLGLVGALGAGPVRDLGLLDSACHRPRSGLLGQEAYPTLAGKASALLHSLACNHALVDGNKRLALLGTVIFLRINGYYLDLTDDEAFDLILSVAAGQFDAAEIEKRLRLVPVTRGGSWKPRQVG